MKQARRAETPSAVTGVNMVLFKGLQLSDALFLESPRMVLSPFLFSFPSVSKDKHLTSSQHAVASWWKRCTASAPNSITVTRAQVQLVAS